MTVQEVAYHKPANAEGGLYVHLTDLTDADIKNGTANARAEELAHENGYRAWGRRTTGMPVWDPGTRKSSWSFWFHERSK